MPWSLELLLAMGPRRLCPSPFHCQNPYGGGLRTKHNLAAGLALQTVPRCCGVKTASRFDIVRIRISAAPKCCHWQLVVFDVAVLLWCWCLWCPCCFAGCDFFAQHLSHSLHTQATPSAVPGLRKMCENCGKARWTCECNEVENGQE